MRKLVDEINKLIIETFINNSDIFFKTNVIIFISVFFTSLVSVQIIIRVFSDFLRGRRRG